MYLDRVSVTNPDTPLIVSDARARLQWEAVLAQQGASHDVSVWPTRPILTWSRWLEQSWQSAAIAGRVERNRFTLNSDQTIRLWRRVIEESRTGEALVGSRSVAGWARSARRQLLDAGLNPAAQHGPLWQHDSAAFLEWNRELERRLNLNDWIDPDSLLFRVNRLPVDAVAHDVVWLDLTDGSIEAAHLASRWREAGYGVATIAPDALHADPSLLIAADPVEELERAVDWAAAGLAAHSDSLLAVVVPDLDSDREAAVTLFADRLGPGQVGSTSTPRLTDMAVAGAAFDVIRLLGSRANFDVLSRWLRSPYFFGRDDARHGCAAGVEVELRADSRAQPCFADTWRKYGLREFLGRRLPDVVGPLDQALSILPHRATPTTWTGVWQSCLRTLGWQGFELALPDALLRAWDNTFARFSQLTPITGLIDMDSAIDEFLAIADSERILEAMPLRGVLLCSSLDEIGPGFAGAWITGFTADAGYAIGAPNPLLPWPLQRDNLMPGASPESDAAKASIALERLASRVPVAVFSCPREVEQQPQSPSPLLSGWRTAPPRPAADRSRTGFAAGRIGARSWQELTDAAPPLGSDDIPGGAGTLDLQALCPLKAFCIARLRAEPLPLPVRGIDPRLRGMLMHRVLELLFDPRTSGTLVATIGGCVAAAVRELMPPGDAAWQAQANAESARLEQIVRDFVEIDSQRARVATVAVEHRTELTIQGLKLRCRIDRIDRLANGADLVIDYKTGRTSSNRWFEARLSDCQLPLYAQAAGTDGIAIIGLGSDGIEYRAAGTAALSLPGRATLFDDREWRDQLDRWREQLAVLTSEFDAGDVRVRSDAGEFVGSEAREHAGGRFAPLSRAGDAR